MYPKMNPATKQLALTKLRDGLSNKEVADLTGLSPRSIGRLKSSLNGKAAVPSGGAQPGKAAPPAQEDKPQTGNEEKTTLDFQDSPAPVEHKNVVDSAWSSLKGMLGIADKEETAAQPILSGPLDAKRKQFVDSAAPTLSLAFMALAGWLWGHIGPEYRVLAPSDEVAARIVTPMLRIYARHANFLTDINPDVADVGASMFALVGYVHASLELYQHIKYDLEADDEGTQNNGSNGHWRAYRTTGPIAPESGAGNQGSGLADVQRGGGGNANGNGSNGGHPGGVSVPNLSDKEARQYAALSRLGQLDFEHRARRSMRS